MNVKPIPDGYASLTPYLVVQGCDQAIEFYKKAFNATERMRIPGPNGRVAHAEIVIEGSVIMLGEECPMTGKGAKALGGTPVSLYLYVKDVDATYNQALSAGATAKSPVQNQFYGDRSGGLTDPFGHVWHVATHVEDVSPQELAKRTAAMAKKS